MFSIDHNAAIDGNCSKVPQEMKRGPQQNRGTCAGDAGSDGVSPHYRRGLLHPEGVSQGNLKSGSRPGSVSRARTNDNVHCPVFSGRSQRCSPAGWQLSVLKIYGCRSEFAIEYDSSEEEQDSTGRKIRGSRSMHAGLQTNSETSSE
jgi:hypothetical protein